MRVFVAGATGVLGRRVVPLLVASGAEVSAVARHPDKARRLTETGAAPVTVDLFDLGWTADAVNGHDVVLNLATKIPPTNRMLLPRAWAENDRLRREASSNLVDAALAAAASVYLQESIVFTYADGADRWIDEDAPVEAGGGLASALDAEAQAQRFTAAGGRGVALRFGQFVAPDATHTQDLLRSAARGILPLFGVPDGYETFVHADDAAAAVVAALDVAAGTYNVAEDEPATRAEHAEIWSELLNRTVRLPPAAAGRLPRVRLRARSQRVSNARFREASGWAPFYPTPRKTWSALIQAASRRGHRRT